MLCNQYFTSKSFDLKILQTTDEVPGAQVLCFKDFAKNAMKKNVAPESGDHGSAQAQLKTPPVANSAAERGSLSEIEELISSLTAVRHGRSPELGLAQSAVLI